MNAGAWHGSGSRQGMPEIFVNDVPQELDPSPATWGELLDTLDAKAIHEGVVLSAARFDGVEEPAFREPAVIRRALSGIGRVDVETAVPAAFLRECLLDVIQPLGQTADAARALADLYRRQDVSSGHAGLTQLAADLRSLTMLIGMLSGPVGVDLATAAGDGVTAAQQIEDLAKALDALVSAQASEDWITVADILEYDLEPAVRRWATILAHVAGRLH